MSSRFYKDKRSGDVLTFKEILNHPKFSEADLFNGNFKPITAETYESETSLQRLDIEEKKLERKLCQEKEALAELRIAMKMKLDEINDYEREIREIRLQVRELRGSIAMNNNQGSYTGKEVK